MIVKALYVLEKVQKSYKNVQKKCPKQNENWTFFQLKSDFSDSLKRYIKKSAGGSSVWVYFIDITKAKDDTYFCEIKKAGAVI